MAGSRFKTHDCPAEVGGGRAPPHGEGRVLVGLANMTDQNSTFPESSKSLLSFLPETTYMYRRLYVHSLLPSHSADIVNIQCYKAARLIDNIYQQLEVDETPY